MGFGNRGRVLAAGTVALSVLVGAHAHAATRQTAPKTQTPSAQKSGQPPVNADAKEMATFLKRVKEYVDLHNKLEATLPHLPKEATPQQIDQHQRALSKLIQDARRRAKPGDVFTPDSRRVVLKLMRQVFSGPDGRQLRDSIMDENPGNIHIEINGRYPDAVPLSTVPPQVLAGLPRLPDEMEFRFIGRRLILMDVHAHTIVDYVDNAIPA
jgi:hypothetical protein